MKIPLENVSLEGYSDWELNDRDTNIIKFLAQEEITFFTFEGIKRRLGLHSETLSRTLSRLEEEGIIKKTGTGYKIIKENAKELKQSHFDDQNSRAVLLQTYLPSYVQAEHLISNLRGRWFGLLRWLGLSENSDEYVLKWITENGDVQIDARISLHNLIIEAKFLHGFKQDLALKAAYQLMNHIGKICSRPHMPKAQLVGYYGQPSFFMMPT